MATKIRIGCVPEHFSSPLYQLAESSDDIEIVTCPGGTGQMIQFLTSGEIDLAMALTEGLVASIANGETRFRLIGTYVASPLTWSVATHPDRRVVSDTIDIPPTEDQANTRWAILRHAKIGISRFGSGSHLIPFVMADKMGWLDEADKVDSLNTSTPFQFEVLKDFKGLRDGVTSGAVDLFLWERFTTKPYYDSQELFHYTSVTPPWPAFMIAASTEFLNSNTQVSAILDRITAATKVFISGGNRDQSVEFLRQKFGYNTEDILSWIGDVWYPSHCNEISTNVVNHCIAILKKAGVISKTSTIDGESDSLVDSKIAKCVI